MRGTKTLTLSLVCELSKMSHNTKLTLTLTPTLTPTLTLTLTLRGSDEPRHRIDAVFVSVHAGALITSI